MSTERFTLRQQRNLSQIIQDSFTLYFENFRLFFGITAILIPFGILIGVLGTILLPTIENASDEDEIIRRVVIVLAILLPVGLLQSFAQWLASIALMAALADLNAGQRVRFSRAYSVVFTRIWTLVGASLRVAAIIIAPLILLIGGPIAISLLGNDDLGGGLFLLGIIISLPWVLYHVIRWLFIHQAVILDNTSSRAALSYSADAVKGRWWRTFGIAIVLGIIVRVPDSIVGRIFALAPIVVSETMGAVVTAGLLPVGIIAMTLLYFDLNARRETDVTIRTA